MPGNIFDHIYNTIKQHVILCDVLYLCNVHAELFDVWMSSSVSF